MSDPIRMIAPWGAGAAAREPGDELAVVVLAAPRLQVEFERAVEARFVRCVFQVLQLCIRGGVS